MRFAFVLIHWCICRFIFCLCICLIRWIQFNYMDEIRNTDNKALSILIQQNLTLSTDFTPRFFGGIRVDHLFRTMCCVRLRRVSCAPNVASFFCIVHSWLPLRFFLTFICPVTCVQCCQFLWNILSELSLRFSVIAFICRIDVVIFGYCHNWRNRL
jgi:hypothetical protein